MTYAAQTRPCSAPLAVSSRLNLRGPSRLEREFFIENLVVRIHFIVEMILVDRPCAMGVCLVQPNPRSEAQSARESARSGPDPTPRPAPGRIQEKREKERERVRACRVRRARTKAQPPCKGGCQQCGTPEACCDPRAGMVGWPENIWKALPRN